MGAYILAKHRDTASRECPALKGKKVTPHVLRRSCAVALLQAGVDINVIRDYLGHESIATTCLYAKVNLHMKRQVLEAFWNRARFSTPARIFSLDAQGERVGFSRVPVGEDSELSGHPQGLRRQLLIIPPPLLAFDSPAGAPQGGYDGRGAVPPFTMGGDESSETQVLSLPNISSTFAGSEPIPVSSGV